MQGKKIEKNQDQGGNKYKGQNSPFSLLSHGAGHNEGFPKIGNLYYFYHVNSPHVSTIAEDINSHDGSKSAN